MSPLKRWLVTRLSQVFFLHYEDEDGAGQRRLLFLNYVAGCVLEVSRPYPYQTWIWYERFLTEKAGLSSANYIQRSYILTVNGLYM